MKALQELLRLKWPLGLSLLTIALLDGIGVNPMNRWAVLLHKLAVVSLAVILAHVVRSELFPYLDLRTYLVSGGARAIAASIIIGLIYAAIILGVTLGL